MASITDGLFNGEAANDLPQRRAWWCDETGHWTLFDTRSGARYNRCDPDGTARDRFASFSVVGMLKLEIDKGVLTLKWDLRGVAQGALAAALEHLDSHGAACRPVRLVFNYGGWHNHCCSSPREAMAAIRRLSSLADTSPLLSLQVKREDLRKVESAEDASLAWGVSAWERSLSRPGEGAIEALHERAIRFAYDRTEAHLLFREIGARSLYAAVFGRQQRERLIGSPCDRGLPGQEKEDELLSRDYAVVLQEGEPALHRIHFPLQSRNGEIHWRSYDRLLLPARSRSGVPELLSYCVEAESSFALLECA